MSGTSEVDAYLAAAPEDQRQVLAELRRTIASAVPSAQEAIRTGVPAVRYRGKTVVGFGSAKRHVALYVMYGQALERVRADLRGFDMSRTVVRFTPERPLPAALVRRIVEIRLTEIDGVGQASPAE